MIEKPAVAPLVRPLLLAVLAPLELKSQVVIAKRFERGDAALQRAGHADGGSAVNFDDRKSVQRIVVHAQGLEIFAVGITLRPGNVHGGRGHAQVAFPPGKIPAVEERPPAVSRTRRRPGHEREKTKNNRKQTRFHLGEKAARITARQFFSGRGGWPPQLGFAPVSGLSRLRACRAPAPRPSTSSRSSCGNWASSSTPSIHPRSMNAISITMPRNSSSAGRLRRRPMPISNSSCIWRSHRRRRRRRWPSPSSIISV